MGVLRDGWRKDVVRGSFRAYRRCARGRRAKGMTAMRAADADDVGLDRHSHLGMASRAGDDQGGHETPRIETEGPPLKLSSTQGRNKGLAPTRSCRPTHPRRRTETSGGCDAWPRCSPATRASVCLSARLYPLRRHGLLESWQCASRCPSAGPWYGKAGNAKSDSTWPINCCHDTNLRQSSKTKHPFGLPCLRPTTPTRL
jgi:hypothetical protein